MFEDRSNTAEMKKYINITQNREKHVCFSLTSFRQNKGTFSAIRHLSSAVHHAVALTPLYRPYNRINNYGSTARRRKREREGRDREEKWHEKGKEGENKHPEVNSSLRSCDETDNSQIMRFFVDRNSWSRLRRFRNISHIT